MKALTIALALVLGIFATGCHVDQASTAPAHRLGLNLGKQLSPIVLTTGNNNNVAIAPNGNTTTMLRFTTNSAGSTITGLDASTVQDGDWFILRNEVSAGQLTFTFEDSNSLVANRMKTPGAQPLVLDPWGSAIAEYDGTLGKWMLSLGSQAAPTFTGAVTTKGNVVANGTAIPVLTSCGTSPAITAGSTDLAGSYTTGSGATTCTITFATAFANAPDCLIINTAGAATLIPTYSTSATAITVTVDIASTAYHYLCVGH